MTSILGAPRPPSIARRIIIGLVSFLAVVGLLRTLADPFEERVSFTHFFTAEQVKPLLATSIVRDASGRLAFVPTPALTAYMADNPEFWFFASDGGTKIHGGAGKAAPGGMPDMIKPHRTPGITFHLKTRAGQVGVLMEGQHGDLWEGFRVWLTAELWEWLVIMIGLAIATTLITVHLVRFLLRPVRDAAEAAAALKPGLHGPALPEFGVPVEILPLVTATNAAFARLEREHDRQRRFIANAAHELRTPIAILGLRLDALPESPEKAVLRHDVTRLAMLANQLLDAERLHAEAAERAPVDIVALGRDVVAELGPLAIGLGSTLAFDTALPRRIVAGDRQALRGVFLNLVSNALNHGGAGITVELRVNADGSVEVTDNGVGIPEEARDRVFEAFQRAGTGIGAATRGGAGLGLYIVREVLRAHGASIELRDHGIGAAFHVLFADLIGTSEPDPAAPPAPA